MDSSLRGLLELLRRLVKAANVDEMFREALRGALELIPGVDAGSIIVCDQDSYRYVAVEGFDFDLLRDVRFSPVRVLKWYGASREEALQACPQAHQVNLHPSDLAQVKDAMADFRWTLVVPIPLKGQLEALLNLDRRDAEPFPAAALELAEELGRSLEVVLCSLRDRERVQERLQREENLSRVLTALSGFKDADALWVSLPGLIADLMLAEQATALRLEGEVLRVMGSLDPEFPAGYTVPRGVGMSWRALEQRQVEFARLDDPRVHLVGTIEKERYYGAFVPLFGPEGRALGTVVFYSEQVLSADDAALLTVLAQGVGNVLSKLEAQTAQARELMRLEAIAKATQALGPARTAEEVYQRTVEEALSQTRATSSVLSRLSPQDNSLEVVAAAGYAAEKAVGKRFYNGEGVAWEVYRRREPLFIADVSQISSSQFASGQRSPGAYLGVPLSDPEGQFIGVLSVDTAGGTAGELGLNDRYSLEALAQVAGVAVSRLSALERARQRAEDYAALVQMSADLEMLADPVQIARRALETLIRLTGFEAGGLYRWQDGAKDRLAPLLLVGQTPQLLETLTIGRPPGSAGLLLDKVMLEGKTLVIENLEARMGEEIHDFGGIRALAAVPLWVDGAVQGFLSLGHFSRPLALSAEGVTLLEATARRVERALERVAGLEAITQARETALRALEQARHQTHNYRALVQMSSDIELLSDPLDVARRALETLVSLTGFEAGGLYRLEPEENAPAEAARLIPVVRVGRYPEPYLSLYQTSPIRVGRGILGRSLLEGTVIIPDYQVWPEAPAEYKASGIRSVMAAALTQGGRSVGVLALGTFTAPVVVSQESTALLESVARRLERALERVAHLEEITRTREAAIRSLGLGLELRDLETKGHTDRVVALSTALGEKLGFGDLEGLRLGAYLHDLGKLAVPDEILQKPGPLTPEEWEIMKTHSQTGYEMLQGLSFLPEVALNVVRYHHERWDGSGYPLGLCQGEIPLEARIFAVIDVYDALSHARPYKPAWPLQEVRRELEARAGKTLDPQVVEAFLTLLVQPV